LDQHAALYERVILNKCHVKYLTASGTTTNGRMDMGIDYDGQDPVATIGGIQLLTPRADPPVWQNAVMVVDPSRAMGGKTTYHYTDHGVPRNSLGSLFAVVASSPVANSGDIWVDYSVTFYGPSPTIADEAVVNPIASTGYGHYVTDTSEWTLDGFAFGNSFQTGAAAEGDIVVDLSAAPAIESDSPLLPIFTVHVSNGSTAYLDQRFILSYTLQFKSTTATLDDVKTGILGEAGLITSDETSAAQVHAGIAASGFEAAGLTTVNTVAIGSFDFTIAPTVTGAGYSTGDQYTLTYSVTVV
jgi:hypothetical protein